MFLFKLILFLIVGGFVLWILFIVFIGKKLYQFDKRQEKKSMKSREEMEVFLDKTLEKLTPKLRKWQSNDIEKITFNRTKAFSRGGFYTQNTKGIIHDIDGNPKIAYALIDNSKEYAKAITRIKTTVFTLDLFYDDNGFALYVDGKAQGNYDKDKLSIIRIYDKFDRHIGMVQRKVGDINRFDVDLIFKEINLYYKNTNQHHFIGFEDGFQAELTNRLAKDRREFAFTCFESYSEEQEKWLMALLVHELTVRNSDSVIDYD